MHLHLMRRDAFDERPRPERDLHLGRQRHAHGIRPAQIRPDPIPRLDQRLSTDRRPAFVQHRPQRDEPLRVGDLPNPTVLTERLRDARLLDARLLVSSGHIHRQQTRINEPVCRATQHRL